MGSIDPARLLGICSRLDDGDRENAPPEGGAFAALGGFGLLIDSGLGDISQRFVGRLLFLKGLLQK